MRKIHNWLLILLLLMAFVTRVWNLNSVPASLYWDEMDAGYQAYSILKTGKDYFGNIPGFVVQSFADFRAPLYIYSVIPFVTILGLNEWSVRLPAAVFGSLNVFLVYLLCKILFKSKNIGLIAALLVAFSPWNIQYSRMAFEQTLMLSLFLAGVITFLAGLNHSSKWILSAIFFSLCMLSYNTAKLFVPLTIFILVLLYIRKKQLNKNFGIGAGIFIVTFLLSLYVSFLQGGGQRFSEISIFTDPQLVATVDLQRSQSALSYTENREVGQSARTIDKLFYNKFTFFTDKITRNYLEAISTSFLFSSGDPNLRHSPAKVGELHVIEFITIIFGMAFLILNLKRGEKSSWLILFWIVLAPLPAVITREGGFHASRLFFLFPALNIVSALGFIYLFKSLPKRVNSAVAGTLIFIWVFNAGFFINYYFGSYTIESAKHFQYGFKEAVGQALRHTVNRDYVIIDDRKDSAVMNYLFYTNYDPILFQSQAKTLAFQLNGFSGSKIDNLIFFEPKTRDWASIFSKNLIDKNFVLVVSSEQFEEETIEKIANRLTKKQKLLDVIYYEDSRAAFYVIESKN